MSVHVNKKFKAYKSGIFNDSDCPKNSANHALLTVGYTISSSSIQLPLISKKVIIIITIIIIE